MSRDFCLERHDRALKILSGSAGLEVFLRGRKLYLDMPLRSLDFAEANDEASSTGLRLMTQSELSRSWSKDWHQWNRFSRTSGFVFSRFVSRPWRREFFGLHSSGNCDFELDRFLSSTKFSQLASHAWYLDGADGMLSVIPIVISYAVRLIAAPEDGPVGF